MPRIGKRFHTVPRLTVPRLLLLGAIFVISFLAIHALKGARIGSVAVQAAAWARQEARPTRDAVPTEAEPGRARQPGAAATPAQEQTRDGGRGASVGSSASAARAIMSTARSATEPPFGDVVNTTPFTVEDPKAYVYSVRMSEYWFLIADKFGIPVDVLRDANRELWRLRGEEIRRGDQMTIPGLSADAMIPAIVYTVEYGDSWHYIADIFSVSFLHLLLDNLELWAQRGIYIRPGDEMTVTYLPSQFASATTARADGTEIYTEIYIVRSGDSWFSIAEKLGISFKSLLAINPRLWGLREQQLWPSDEMNIPSHDRPRTPESREPSIRKGDTVKEMQKGATKAMSVPSGMYEAQTGDTWESVAEAAGIGVQALRDVNREIEGRALRSGDILRISWILHISLVTRPAESRSIMSASDLDTLSEVERAALAERGLFVYKEQYCGVCHRLDSAGTRGLFGPPHDGMGGLAAARLDDPGYNGTATNVYAYLYESIVDPDVYYVEGFAMSPHRMPSYRHIPKDDLEALLVFLAEQ